MHESLGHVEIRSSADRIVVGREPPADFCLDHPSVGQPHCEIVAEAAGFVLNDFGSKGGTRVGSVRIRSAYLPRDTRIRVGEVELDFNSIPQEEVTGRFGGLLGESPPMLEAMQRLARVAARDTTLLIEGENGTGKRLAAEAVHAASPRREAPFVVVDCRSARSAVLEAELFGQDDAASGRSRPGAFVLANGGTLFLAEVGELGLELQRRLLCVLEHHQATPLGSARGTLVNVRLIATTSRDLYREMGRGVFRDDLYYVLAVAGVRLPPLRERLDDIPLLVDHFLKERSLEDGVHHAFDDGTLARLAFRPWPGNVRELRHAVQTILTLGTDELPSVEPSSRPAPVDVPFKAAKARLVESFERDYLTSALSKHGGNITAAATTAGLDRVHFLRLLDRYSLRKSSRTVSE